MISSGLLNSQFFLVQGVEQLVFGNGGVGDGLGFDFCFVPLPDRQTSPVMKSLRKSQTRDSHHIRRLELLRLT